MGAYPGHYYTKLEITIMTFLPKIIFNILSGPGGEAVPSAPYPVGGAPGYPTAPGAGGPYQQQSPYQGPPNGAGATAPPYPP